MIYYDNVDTTNWDVARGANVYTPPANGWLHIRVAVDVVTVASGFDGMCQFFPCQGNV